MVHPGNRGCGGTPMNGGPVPGRLNRHGEMCKFAVPNDFPL